MGLLVRFSGARLYFFTGLHFASMDELVGEKLRARMEINRKTNQPNWPVPPFHSIFQPRSHCSRITFYDSFISQDFFHFSTFIRDGDNLNM